MSFVASRRDGDGDYLLITSGQTRYAPYLAGWQEFKDHIRKVVKEQPGWTHVTQGQRRGENQGWCRLRDREDAEAVYSAYARSGGVVVHIFATSLRSGHFELVKCNCSVVFSDVADRGHSPKRSGIDVGGVNQVVGNHCAVATPQYAVPTQPTYQYAASYYQTPQYAPTTMYPYSAPQMQPMVSQTPAYSQSTGGLPVNLGQGAKLTESRGIFIQSLNYSVGNTELASLIRSVGLTPIEATVHRDSRGSSKGVGSAKFSTKAEAQYGIAMLNGKSHMGKTLTVRMDTNTTVVGQMSPVVVDGTNRSGSGY